MTFDFASTDRLLGIEDICTRLGISRSTFERRFWRVAPPTPGSVSDSIQKSQNLIHGNEFAGAPAFPPPTVVIGRSPRWAVSTLNAWVAKQQSQS